MGKEEEFGECEGISGWVWGKNRSRSKKTGGDRGKIEGKVESKSR